MATEKIKLTTVEKDVLALIVRGMTYPQIAKKLQKPYDTVKSITNRIRSKIGVSTKVQLALWGTRNTGKKYGS